jgi:hypothetical protein
MLMNVSSDGGSLSPEPTWSRTMQADIIASFCVQMSISFNALLMTVAGGSRNGEVEYSHFPGASECFLG